MVVGVIGFRKSTLCGNENSQLCSIPAMLTSAAPKNPVVLSYLALRKAVGAIALALPFVLVIGWWLARHTIETSISGYYYTGMRNIFVGSLCGVAMFMFCCRGYDRKDEFAGIASSIFAVGVAFCPMSPEMDATPFQLRIGAIHYTFAALLFSTLAYFCLVLFKMTAPGVQPSRKKVQRNRVYTFCGFAIIGSILA